MGVELRPGAVLAFHANEADLPPHDDAPLGDHFEETDGPFLEAYNAWNHAYIAATPEAGRPVSLRPPNWQAVYKFEKEASAKAAHAEPQLRQNFQSEIQSASLEHLIEAHFDIAQKEVRFLRPKASYGGFGALVGSAKKSKDPEQLAALQSHLLETIELLNGMPEYDAIKQRYKDLLAQCGEPINSSTGRQELQSKYEAQLQTRHSNDAPRGMSETARIILGTMARVAMLAPEMGFGPGASHTEGRAESRSLMDVGRLQEGGLNSLSTQYVASVDPVFVEIPERIHELQFPNEMPPRDRAVLQALIPNATMVEPVVRSGINTPYRVYTSHGDVMFFKTFIGSEENTLKLAEHLLPRHEAAASTLANHISAGLLPEGKALGNSIAYPFNEIDWTATDRIFHSPQLYSQLNHVQRVDLFVSMLTDIVLQNTDVHAGQFGVGQDGHLIAFDKGRSYWSVYESNEDFSNGPVLKDRRVYDQFIAGLRSRPDDLKALLLDERVGDALLRVRQLTEASEQESVEQLLAPIFSTIAERVNNRQSEMERIKANYFKMLRGIPQFLAQELGVEISRIPTSSRVHAIQVDELSPSTTALVFDPKKHQMRLVAPLSEGYSAGGRVEDITRNAGAIAGVNAGFFSGGAGARWSLGWMVGKAKQFSGAETQAFPSAVLKVGDQLLSDTDAYQPLIGWNQDGSHFEFGEVKVAWQATLVPGSTPIPLIRVTPISTHTALANFYYDDAGVTHSIEVQNGVISKIEHDVKVDEEKPNGYVLKTPVATGIERFRALKIGDGLSQAYALEAKDQTQTARMAGLDYMVSGSDILIREGEVSGDFSDHTSIETRRTAVGLMPDGQVIIIAETGGTTLPAFAKLIRDKYQCRYAINLDGGGSTTLVTPPDADGISQRLGTNIVVSDAIVVMPNDSAKLSSRLQRDDDAVFRTLLRGDFEQLEAFLAASPARIHSRNQNGQSLLQVYLRKTEHGKADNQIIGLLLSKMAEIDLEHQDLFGETVIHTALRSGYDDLAKKMLSRLEPGSAVWDKRGIHGQYIDEIGGSFPVSDEKIEKRAFEDMANQRQASVIQKSITDLAEGRRVDLAIRIAEKALLEFGDYDDDIQYRSLNLIDGLLASGSVSEAQKEHFLMAVIHAKDASEFFDFVTMYARESAISSMIALAGKLIESSDQNARQQGLRCLAELVQRGYGNSQVAALLVSLKLSWSEAAILMKAAMFQSSPN
ncbi:MAG: phosphodiester glycosidase family protein [Myxococcota bacterium]